jgi:ATP:ADP antiporter, AAA family
MSLAAPPQSPLAKLVNIAAKVEPRKIAVVVAGFFLFFFVLGSSFAVRPVRETMGTMLGAAYVADL